MSNSLPSTADVVIIGGGVIGCSIAYHLMKLGVRDVTLLERWQLTCGTTWHAAGLVGQLRATRNLTELAKYTSDLLHSLEDETGQATGFRQNGSFSVALNAERMEELRRQAAGWRNHIRNVRTSTGSFARHGLCTSRRADGCRMDRGTEF